MVERPSKNGVSFNYVEPFSAFGNGDGRSWDGVKQQKAFGQEAEMISKEEQHLGLQRLKSQIVRFILILKL